MWKTCIFILSDSEVKHLQRCFFEDLYEESYLEFDSVGECGHPWPFRESRTSLSGSFLFHVFSKLTMADEEENLVDYEEEALDEKADGGDEKEIKKYVHTSFFFYQATLAVGGGDCRALA